MIFVNCMIRAQMKHKEDIYKLRNAAFFRGKPPEMITFSPDHFTNASIFIIITLCSDEGNAQNVSQHTLYGVQHIHINLTLILILLFIIRFGAGKE